MSTDARTLPDPPGPRGGWPGAMLLRFRNEPLTLLPELRDRYGDVSHFRIGPRWFYVLAHPDDVRDVLVVRNRNFIKSLALQRTRVLLGEGLLTSEEPLHLRQRRLAQPAFHRERVEGYAAVMVAHARRMAEGWRAGEVVEMAREMNRLALGIAGETLFGADVAGEADEIGAALTDALALFDRLTNPLGRLLDYLPVPGTLRMRRARRRLDDTVLRMITAARARGATPRDDLLSLLLAARDEEGDGTGMTDAQLRDEVLTIFLAGHETTANALAWTWHLLAANPEAEAALHAELDAVLGQHDPAPEDYARLPVTRATFAEAMRLFPPAWAIGRQPLADFALRGYRIRAGSVVILSPWTTHRDARFFPESERFRPQRWLTPREEEAESAAHRFTYFPFGGGPRKCIGEGFAWMEGVLVLATLARRWRAHSLPDAAPVQPEPRITLRPSGGMPMRLQAR